jgi:thiamine-monophosphate kinase
VKEFRLLSKVYEHNASLDARVTIPPGDDMGMVRIDGGDVLAAVDQIVAGRHFTLGSTPLSLIGRKAVTRNLSDIAAMAARPVASLAAVVLPLNWEESQALELFEAMRTTAQRYSCPLIGGDIAMADAPLMCSVTVLATPGPRGAIRRRGAKSGDSVYVSGHLGGSVDGGGGGRHLTFEPRIELALALAKQFDLHAMIDISDGLGRDAGHIAEMSGVQIEIDAASIPCMPGCAWRSAMSDGEDYELCFTLAAGADVPSRLAGVPLTRIGAVRERAAGEPAVVVRAGAEIFDATRLGWEHGAAGAA